MRSLAFNLAYDDERLGRVDPQDGERLRLSSPADAETALRFTVRQRPLPPYNGDAAGYMPLYAGPPPPSGVTQTIF